jgi:hypothetical protein
MTPASPSCATSVGLGATFCAGSPQRDAEVLLDLAVGLESRQIAQDRRGRLAQRCGDIRSGDRVIPGVPLFGQIVEDAVVEFALRHVVVRRVLE